jgi:outer membrane protein assembly factor BamB
VAVNACSSAARLGPATQDRVWPVYLGSAARATAGGDTMAGDPRPVWRVRVARGIAGVPALGEDVVALALLDNYLALLDRATGEVIWRRRVGGPPAAGPLLRDDRLFVATQGRDGGVAAFRLADGRQLWFTRVGDVAAAPALDDAALYAAGADGWVACVDAASGRVRWRVRVAGGARVAPVPVGPLVVVATTADSLFALDTATGRTMIRRATPGTVLASPALAGGRLVIGTSTGHLAALDTANLRTAWFRDAGSAVVGTVAVRDGVAYALTAAGLLWRVPLAEPAAADSRALGLVARAGPHPVPGGLYVAGVDGWIARLDDAGTRRWTARVRSPVVEPPVQDGRMLFVVSQRGEVVAFR